VLHVRIASPPEVTSGLLETLAADSGVLNLVVLKGAVRQPDGDAVQFDLQMGSANQLFRQLREPGLAGLRSVAVETVDAYNAIIAAAVAFGVSIRASGQNGWPGASCCPGQRQVISRRARLPRIRSARRWCPPPRRPWRAPTAAVPAGTAARPSH
jgi:hypothetical protein